VNLIRSVGMMAVAGVFAQAVPLLLMPVLSRLYTPVDLGILALIVSIATIMAPLSTGRYELAIMLPKNEADAQAIAGLAITLAVIVASLAFLLSIVAIPRLQAMGKLDPHGVWLYCAPLLAFAISVGQTGNVLVNRRGGYGRIARAGISQQLVNGICATLFGLVVSSPLGLVTGRVMGALTYTATFGTDVVEALRGFGRRWHVTDALREARRYRQFAFFNMPYSLLGGFSRDFLVYAFTAFRDVAAAGQFGLARLLLNAPTSLLAASLSQVFYQQAVVNGGSDAFRRVTSSMLQATVVGIVPACGVLALWGPDVFAVAFGERWREAGLFASYLAAPLAFGVLTSWPDRIFEANLKQHWAFVIQITFDALSIGTVLLLMVSGTEKSVTVLAYAGVQVIFHLCYLGAVFRFAGLRAAKYIEVVLLTSGLFVGLFAIGIALKYLTSPLAAFSLHVVIGALISMAGLWLVRAQYLRQSAA
jgi:O-antigen/teichoic acid export membrane protein